jgi:hypothetical protein
MGKIDAFRYPLSAVRLTRIANPLRAGWTLSWKTTSKNPSMRLCMTDEVEILWEIGVPFKEFLTMTACPPRWRGFDLYMFSDGETAFYVGQSHCAFERVWDHIYAGPKGHSIIGRFCLANWPRSGRFTLGLLSSGSPRFAGVGHNLDAAERVLIEELRPCFNVSLNSSPLPLPAGYIPPNQSIKYLRNFKRMLREAGYVRRGSGEDMVW